MASYRPSRRALLLAASGLLLPACTRQSRSGSAGAIDVTTTRELYGAQLHQNGLWLTVKKGDTLSSIKRRSGVSIARIAEANKLNSNRIYPGQRLWLPGARVITTDPLAQVTEDTAQPVRDWNGAQYRLVKREQWTSNSLRKNRRSMGTINKITIHHTGEHGNWSNMPDRDVVRSIENYHRNERKWACIGYHYLIGRDGDIFEGRPAIYQGAHTRGANRGALGVSVIGDFNKHPPSAQQRAILQTFIESTRNRYGLGRDRVFGHRDLSPSECPGTHLYRWLQGYKA